MAVRFATEPPLTNSPDAETGKPHSCFIQSIVTSSITVGPDASSQVPEYTLYPVASVSAITDTKLIGLGTKAKNPLISTALKGLYDFKNFFKKSEKAQVDIPDQWKERLRDFYSESNQALMKNFNLPIIKYGYPI